jgi:hypothetical protein
VSPDLFARVPPEVTVVEVGPRDGLQNEPEPVPLAAKVALVEALADAGLPSSRQDPSSRPSGSRRWPRATPSCARSVAARVCATPSSSRT